MDGDLGGLLKEFREAAALTQAAAARAIGVSAVTLWRWERGEFAPSAARTPAIVAAYRLDDASVGRLARLAMGLP